MTPKPMVRLASPMGRSLLVRSSAEDKPEVKTERALFSKVRVQSGALLIRPDDLGVADDVALQGLLEVGLRRRPQVGELDVERVELEEVAVAADRRAGAAPAGLPPVV